MAKIRIKDSNLDVNIKTDLDVSGLDVLIDNLIVPALLGLGYSDNLIAQYINSGVINGYKKSDNW